ncbi:MAG TPA: hypothetical protein ENF57_03550 [Candidatus Korarchaeota archaeon]|nr:hypothetical protein [Candidatus Korarchaeota archaeon]
MPHITLSIPKELFEEMKKYPEVKWSEVARKAIRRYLMELKDEIDGEDLLKELPQEIRRGIEELQWEEFSEEVVKLRGFRPGGS